MQMATTIRLQMQGWGKGSLSPQGLSLASGWPSQGPWSPAGHSPQPAPWAPQRTCWPPGELEGPRKKAGIRLSPHSLPGDHNFTDLLQNEGLMTNGGSLAAGFLWEGPGASQWLSRNTKGPLATTAW